MKTEKNIFVAFILNLVFSVFELLGGVYTGSIGILSDSLHDIGDALSIGVSYFLEKKSKKGADEAHTYGYIRYSVLGGIITSVVLFVSSVVVIYESIKRLINPVIINYDGMIIFAIIGVIVNSIASFYTREGDSINQKSVNLHMLEDVLGWIVVLIGSVVMKFTKITYIDSILSIIVALFILINTIKNLRTILDLFLEKTPKEVDIKELKDHLLKIDGVKDTHHIHVRSIDGFKNAASLHVVVDEYDSEVKKKVKEELLEHGIDHSTVEIELATENCEDDICEIKPHKGHIHHH